MRWATGLGTNEDFERALDEALEGVQTRLDGAPPDLVLAFVSAHHAEHFDRVPSAVRARVRHAHLVGCTAGGVVAEGREVEEGPAVAIVGALLPRVDIHPFHLSQGALPPPAAGPAAWRAAVGLEHHDEANLIVLPDPFSCDPQRIARGLDAAFPAGTVVGGLASAARAPHGNALYLDGAVHRAGAVGVALTGDVTVDTIVAQGCRPVGTPMFVTRCRRHVIFELDGRPAAEALETVFHELPNRDRELFRQAPFLGIVMDPARQAYHHGDFLVRNLVGLDPRAGALVVAAPIEPNQVVQFHLRDARTSADDLDALLTRYQQRYGVLSPRGALLFSCLGRGRGLYGEPDHDTRAFLERVGPVPIGGFFCNGEIGPVQGHAFVHGYTSVFALFRPRRPAP